MIRKVAISNKVFSAPNFHAFGLAKLRPVFFARACHHKYGQNQSHSHKLQYALAKIKQKHEASFVNTKCELKIVNAS